MPLDYTPLKTTGNGANIAGLGQTAIADPGKIKTAAFRRTMAVGTGKSPRLKLQ